MVRTANQNAKFHKLLTLRKFDREDKQELVMKITNGRETSSSKMTQDEMAEAIKFLDDEQNASVKRMRAKILNIGRDIFGLTPKQEFEQKHYDALNTFLTGKYKVKLHELTYEQLIKAVTSMERWRDSETSKMVKGILNDL